jgi:DNA-binding transcriptional ArsR family regulator
MKKRHEQLPEIFKALSCKTRFDIVVGLIKHNECNVTKMAENLQIPQPNISQHLTVLKNTGVIEGFRRGNQICYKVVNKTVIKIIEAIIEDME